MSFMKEIKIKKEKRLSQIMIIILMEVYGLVMRLIQLQEID